MQDLSPRLDPAACADRRAVGIPEDEVYALNARAHHRQNRRRNPCPGAETEETSHLNRQETMKLSLPSVRFSAAGSPQYLSAKNAPALCAP